MSLPQNQEDAIIIKRGTLERGAFMVSDSRDYISESGNPSTTKSEKFEKPDDVISKKNVSYDHIMENGLPVVGTMVAGGDVIIGKTQMVKRQSISKNDVKHTTRSCDISTCCKQSEGGRISKVESSTLPTGTRVRVELTTTRVPAVGDKFTSQYAQKGVIGGIWEDTDMPFSMRTGMSPDMIVSPLSMTSRMTMSELLEALGGKAVCVSGDYGLGVDNQDFSQSNQQYQEKFGKILLENGFAADGTEKFIDGRTGEMITARIFVGVVEYYRLVHIASKKIHARSTGPRDPLTRQPRDGRRFGGGLRIGEMESSALAAHGSSHVLQERFRELSDVFEIYVCASCQLMCDDVCLDIEYQYCRHCQSNSSVRSVLVPFTFLVLTLELMSTGIVTNFHVK
jgi:DNA-directed RNA polymerase beta subunit